MAQTKSPRIIYFAGMAWQVRSGTGNPDNNNWSDSQKSVWIDPLNRLHLKVRKIHNKWMSVEIKSLRPTTYGTHRFYMDSRIDQLDKNLVAGLFIYKGHNQEMDIEFSKWRQENVPNAQFVVQPETPENMKKFNIQLQGTYSTHLIDWQAQKIIFKSFYGHNFQPPNANYLIQQWKYDKKHLADDKKYYIHINLWLSHNQAPVNSKHTELIISSIDTPISPIVINSENAYEKIALYPNFKQNTIFVYLYDKTPASYELVNQKGEKILHEQTISPSFNIDVSTVPKGKYQLIFMINNRKFKYRLQKNY